MIDPAAKKLMSYFPAPNFNQGAPGGGYSPYYNWVAIRRHWTGQSPVGLENRSEFW